MSFREYLHEKAEESRHNETLAYLMFLAGTVFFVGGVLETLSLDESPGWLLFIPYSAELNAGGFLGLTLTIIGIFLIVFGIAAGLNFSRNRGWYMQELAKANSIDEALMHRESKQSVRKKRKVKT